MTWRVESRLETQWWYSRPHRSWIAYEWGDQDTLEIFNTWQEAYDYALSEARSQKFQEVLDKVMSNPGTRAVMAALAQGPCDGCPSCDAEECTSCGVRQGYLGLCEDCMED